MAAAAILNYNFVMLDHPQSPFVQLSCWSSAYFSKYCDLEISKIWLKTPLQAPKSCFWEFWPPNIIFIIETPKSDYHTRKDAFWAINGRDRSSGVTCRCGKVYKKDRTQKVTENALPTHTPFPSSHINQILRAGSYPRYLSRFWVSLESVEKCGSCVGSKFWPSIDLAHRLYNSLLLLHKPWPTLLNWQAILLHMISS